MLSRWRHDATPLSKNAMVERFYGKHFAFLIHFRTLKLAWKLFYCHFTYLLTIPGCIARGINIKSARIPLMFFRSIISLLFFFLFLLLVSFVCSPLIVLEFFYYFVFHLVSSKIYKNFHSISKLGYRQKPHMTKTPPTKSPPTKSPTTISPATKTPNYGIQTKNPHFNPEWNLKTWDDSQKHSA